MATAAKTAAKAAPAKTAAKTANKGGANVPALVKPKAGALATNELQEQLRKQAEAMAGRVQPPSGNKIQVTQAKQFKLPNGTTANEVTVCVLDFRTVHNFYEGKYDPKNIQPPVCFAVGMNPKDMTPVEDSPKLQAENCQICPMNQFGSDGDGKACKNGRRLAVLPPGEEDGTVAHEDDIWIMDVSPTALKAWDGYVATLARTFNQPPLSFLVDVSFDPSVEYPRLQFTNPRPHTNVAEVFARQAEAKDLLEAKPDWAGWAAQQDKKPAAKTPARGARR